jgi:acetolactate decarboxylase
VSFDVRLAHSLTVHRLRMSELGSGGAVPTHSGARSPDDGSTIIQVQTIEALMDGRYEGYVTVGDLTGTGDVGLGTLEGLDGEVVVVDGEFWNIGIDGVARRADPSARVPFAAVVEFNAADRFTLDGPVTREEFETAVRRHLDDPDGCYALRVDGTFAPVVFRSVARQEPPYRPLAEVIADSERLFTAERLESTLVGFHFPDYAGDVGAAGFHFHMLAADRSTGGHVYDFTFLGGEVVIGPSTSVNVALPERNLAELLEMQGSLRTVHLALVRTGGATVAELSAITGLGIDDVTEAISRLVRRGMADPEGGDEVLSRGDDPAADPGEVAYRPHLAHHRPSQLPPALDDL